ncbi:hypothetical protein [Dongia sp.]|uniref:hypothetical protein n=1 Tax=Dongia sp. TaxID=1977262 RepID=UPI0035ADFB47
MLLAAVLLLNGILVTLADMGQAQADALPSVFSGEMCLGGMVDAGEGASGTKQRPAEQRDCPACTATCALGGCTPTDMLPKALDVKGRMELASLKVGDRKSLVLPRVLRHHTTAQAQAPPSGVDIKALLIQGGAA